tara:strand:- start:1350 stop:1655 length:306 start_codon:yes stop_codon:yes gene_type:complete
MKTNIVFTPAAKELLLPPGVEQKDVWCLGGNCNWGLTESPNVPPNFLAFFNPVTPTLCYAECATPPIVCTVDCGVTNVPIPTAMLLFSSGLVLLIALVKRR